MTKKFSILCLLILSMMLYGCKDDVKEVEIVGDVSKEDIETYLETSKKLSNIILSNSTFEKLKEGLDEYKNKIEPKLFTDRFDLSNEMNKMYYSYDFKLEQKEFLNIYADTVQSDEVVKVILISSYFAEYDNVDISDGTINVFTEISTEVYEYNKETKQLVNYVQYR